MQTWPSSLQLILNSAAFNLKMGDTVLRSEMDVGPAKVRRRFTKAIDVFDCTIWLDRDDFNLFYNFFNTTLAGGSLTFGYDHPFTGVLTEFRFQSAPSMEPVGSGGLVFQVKMVWESMP